MMGGPGMPPFGLPFPGARHTGFLCILGIADVSIDAPVPGMPPPLVLNPASRLPQWAACRNAMTWIATSLTSLLAGGMPGIRPPMGPPPDQAHMPDGNGLAFGFDGFGAAGLPHLFLSPKHGDCALRYHHHHLGWS